MCHVTDVEAVIHRTIKVTQQLELMKESLDHDGEMYLESAGRMRRHVELVESLESCCVHNRALREQRHTVKILRQQSKIFMIIITNLTKTCFRRAGGRTGGRADTDILTHTHITRTHT